MELYAAWSESYRRAPRNQVGVVAIKIIARWTTNGWVDPWTIYRYTQIG